MTNTIKTARPARWIALALVGALALAATPSAFARPGPGHHHHGPPPPPAHHHHRHHHAGSFIAGAAIAGLTFGVIDAIARPCPPPPPPPPPPPVIYQPAPSTVVYTTPASTVSYTTYSPAPVVYSYPPPPPPPPRWRYGY